MLCMTFIEISARQSNTKEKLLKRQTASRIKRKSDKNLVNKVVKTTTDSHGETLYYIRFLLFSDVGVANDFRNLRSSTLYH